VFKICLGGQPIVFASPISDSPIDRVLDLIFDILSIIVNSVADPDPGSYAFLTPGSGIRDG
jgi:uncharacterized membrane protein